MTPSAFYYRVFGLTLRSDVALPSLNPLPEMPTVDFRVLFATARHRFDFDHKMDVAPSYVSSLHVSDAQPAVQFWEMKDESSYLFRFYDDVRFLVRCDSKDIHIVFPTSASLQVATHHMLFSLTGFLLGLRGGLCLQGAAFEARVGAIVLLGASKSGKSVLSAAIASRGCKVMSDDLVAIHRRDGVPEVHPGYPWISLRPGSLNLLGSCDRDRVGPEWDYLDEQYQSMNLRGMGADARPKSIEAVLVLSPEAGSERPPSIESLTQQEALMALMRAAERIRIPHRKFRQQEFRLSGAIAASTPAFKLRYSLTSETLTEVTDLLLQPNSTRM